jgi:hypothetical protein
MRKLEGHLLGSTALVAGGLVAMPAMAADPIKVGVGGYYTFYVMAGQLEGTTATNGQFLSFKSPVFWQEGEIHFIGRTKLDNGTTVGVRVELEGWNPSTTGSIPVGAAAPAGQNRQIDEAFIFAFGDWGRIEFGAHKGAGFQMAYSAPSALIQWSWPQVDTGVGWLNPIAAANNVAAFRITSAVVGNNFADVNELTYYTPRIAGLQIGATYAPKATPNLSVGGAPALGLAPGPGTNSAGICGYNDATAVANCPNQDWSWQDVFQIAANYINRFGDVSVAAYVGYLYANFYGGNASAQPGAAGGSLTLIPSFAVNVFNGANLAPWQQLSVGLQLNYAGFTLGGSFCWDNNGLGRNIYTGGDNDTRLYLVGIMYETGPWQISFGWGHAVNDNGNGSPTVSAIASGGNAATYNFTSTTPTCNYFSGNNQAPIAGSCFGGGATWGRLTASKFELGANYVLGPGVKLTGGAVFNNLSGPTNATSAQSWVLLLGMDLRF